MDEGTFADLELKDDSDTPDIAVDSWNMILLQPGSKIFWPDLYEMDVRTREQQEEAGGEAGGEAGRERLRELEAGGNAGVEAGGEPGGEAGGEPGGEAGRERLRELELKLNKRMDDGFALRDEKIRLLTARVKELEEDKIQRENWSFQVETDYVSGGRRREGEMHGDKDGEDGDEVDSDDDEADKDGEDGDEVDSDDDEADKDGEDGEKQIEAEAEKDGEKQIEAEKDGETAAEKLVQDTEERFDEDGDEQSTLQIMADTAERFEKAAAEKAAADKTDSQDAGERPKRVSKVSHLLRSPFTPN
ncbi:DUF287 domain-containing protein [Raphanus sativus]|nr:DUF287 domain-containing protein [Raphanus sativus]